MQTNNKLREALEATNKFLESAITDGKVTARDITALRDIVSAARSEPVRNCEVGTVEEQANRWYWRYHVGHLCQSCPLGPRKWSEIGAGWFCFSEWLQKPYKEGGDK